MRKVGSAISVVLPVYNGEKFIRKSIVALSKFLRSLDCSWEIIVVNDGSSDSTPHILKKLQNDFHPFLRVFGYRVNKGKGYAFRFGALRARGDVIVLHDSDLDIPPEQILVLLKAMRDSDADIVVTSKWHPKSKVTASFLRKFLSYGFRLLVRLFTGLKLRDTQTGSKAFKRGVLERILPYMRVKRYAFDVELLYLAKCFGFKIVEVPAIKPIKLGSNFSFREIFHMFIDLLAITYWYRIKKIWKARKYVPVRSLSY